MSAVIECRPPDGTAPMTAHLLSGSEEPTPWIWTGDGWIAVKKCEPISPFRMGWLGWTYGGAQ